MNKCIVCNKEFEGKRVDARFCSDACRKKLSRTNKPDIVRDNVTLNVRDNIAPDTEPNKPDKLHIIYHNGKRYEADLSTVCKDSDIKEYLSYCETRWLCKENGGFISNLP